MRECPNSHEQEDAPAGGLGTEIAALLARAGLTSEIPELRGYPIEPAKF
jgi:hypothetical protein